MHPDCSSITGTSEQGNSFDEHMCISPSYLLAASSQETSTVGHPQYSNETSQSTLNCSHNRSTFGSLCSRGPPPDTTPYDLPHRCAACTGAFTGQLERPDRPFSSSVLMHGSGQPREWFDPSTAGASSISDGREDVGTALYEDRIIIDAQLSPPLYQPNRSRQKPVPTINPYAFRVLPGYCGKRNDKGHFECLADCHKNRFGPRGFRRRGNLLVHLRNCHGQKIPKYDRGMLSTGASE